METYAAEEDATLRRLSNKSSLIIPLLTRLVSSITIKVVYLTTRKYLQDGYIIHTSPRTQRAKPTKYTFYNSMDVDYRDMQTSMSQ